MSSAMAWRRGFFHFGGGGKIGKALGEVDGVMLQGQTGHFADDGFGELFGLGGKHASRNVGHVGFGCRHGGNIVTQARAMVRNR